VPQRRPKREVAVLHRISGHARANAVAYVALFVALSGTAVASSLKLSANSVGTAQLKNGAVTGRKVARSTLTGANIKASTLGTVPNATNATNAVNATKAVTATNAVNATNASNAANAANATNAAELGGQAPASFQGRVSGACASGSAIASIAAAGTVACQSTNVTQIMGGTEQLNPTVTPAHFLAAWGLTPTPVPTTETDGVGTSTVAGTASNLNIGIFEVEPADLAFTLDVNDAPSGVGCTIPAGGTTCSDSTDTASIPADALVDIRATGGSGAATQVAFGWTDTTSG
jgi:hypothetical protein